MPVTYPLTVIPEAVQRLSGTQIESLTPWKKPNLGPGSEFILGRALRATRARFALRRG